MLPLPIQASFFLLVLLSCHAYIHKPCSRSVRPQFQFPDCYLPSMNTDLLLAEASFVMAHNSGTGYIVRGKPTPSGVSWPSSQNQVGSAYQQLQDGARALDVRPKLLLNGTVILQHDFINIPATLEQLVMDAIEWCNDNPDELVLILTSNYMYQASNLTYTDMVSALASVYEKLGVTYASCNDVSELTVGETMQLASLSNGGYLIAMGQYDGNSEGGVCYKSNWVQSRLVSCYKKVDGKITSCTSDEQPWIDLQQYMLESTNNEPTDDQNTLGPPASTDEVPLNCVQAIWQYTVESTTIGLAKFSSLIKDNTKSKVNAKVVDMIYENRDDFQTPISLLMVDNVAVNGNALLSVLRTTCGQSTLDEDACGQFAPRPRMNYFHFSSLLRGIMLIMSLGIFFSIGYLLLKKEGYHPNRTIMTIIDRLKGPNSSKGDYEYADPNW